MKQKAVYAGTFDPITNGHIDIIKRAIKMFGGVTVAVAESSHKKPLFSRKERVSMVKQAVKNIKGARADSYTGLLVNYLKKTKLFIIKEKYNTLVSGKKAGVYKLTKQHPEIK